MSHWLWLLLFAILLTPPWPTRMVASDGDPCRHWAVGEQMLQTREIMRVDTFSHTRAETPVIASEWLAELIFAAAGRWRGLDGLAVVAALVIATALALLHRQLWRAEGNLTVATAVTLLAAWATSIQWLARPDVFSLLMVLFWNAVLGRHERDRQLRPLIIRLVFLAVVWVNLTGAFLTGLLLVGAYLAGAFWERDRTRVRHLVLAGALVVVVTLANPAGYELHLRELAFLRSEFLRDWLAEYRSVDFQSAAARGFVVWLALLFFTLAIGRPRLPVSAGLVLLLSTYGALYATRNIPLMVILTAPTVAAVLSRALAGGRFTRWMQGQPVPLSRHGWPVVALLGLSLVLWAARPATMPRADWPLDAVTHIRQHPERFRGAMFNDYAWGGYLMRSLPEQRVFVDGRAAFYGEDFLRAFEATSSLATNWPAALHDYDVRWTLLPASHRLNQALQLLPDWNEEYRDPVAVIYRRTP